ncbi:MAG TPA: stage II sporulation protein M [Thermoanaerobacterales bacterium]|nr:stage II sporulation protein M [Thermoanaerobacterales bacterium]
MFKGIFNNIKKPFIRYRKYIIVTIIIFIISTIYGALRVGSISPEEALSINEEFLQPIFTENPFNDFIAKYFGSSIFWLILLRNISATAIVLYGSLISVGIIGIFAIISNGQLIGLALNVLTTASKLPLYKIVLAGILPHGFIELPAFFLACSLGLYAGTNTIRTIFKKNDLTFLELIKRFTHILISIIIPLLIVAALIEAYITPIIFEFVSS